MLVEVVHSKPEKCCQCGRTCYVRLDNGQCDLCDNDLTPIKGVSCRKCKLDGSVFAKLIMTFEDSEEEFPTGTLYECCLCEEVWASEVVYAGD